MSNLYAYTMQCDTYHYNITMVFASLKESIFILF